MAGSRRCIGQWVIRTVIVNGRPATATAPNFAEWEVVLDAATDAITAHAEDAAGNVETHVHRVALPRQP